MKILSNLFLALICLLPTIGFADHYCDKISNNLIGKSSKYLEKKYKMKEIGFGKAMKKNLKSLSLSFQVYRPLDKNEARAMAVGIVQDFLFDINNDEKIRQYLDDYPFDSKNVDITIYIDKPNREGFYYPDISVVTASCGNIRYSTNDPDKTKYTYKTEEVESFEDAVKILKGETPTTP